MLAVLEGAVSDFQKYATASSGRGRGSSPMRTRGSGRLPPIGLSISRASARLSGSPHRSSGQACTAGAARGDGSRVNRGRCFASPSAGWAGHDTWSPRCR